MAILSLQCFAEFSSVAVVTELATVWSVGVSSAVCLLRHTAQLVLGYPF